MRACCVGHSHSHAHDAVSVIGWGWGLGVRFKVFRAQLAKNFYHFIFTANLAFCSWVSGPCNRKIGVRGRAGPSEVKHVLGCSLLLRQSVERKRLPSMPSSCRFYFRIRTGRWDADAPSHRIHHCPNLNLISQATETLPHSSLLASPPRHAAMCAGTAVEVRVQRALEAERGGRPVGES